MYLSNQRHPFLISASSFSVPGLPYTNTAIPNATTTTAQTLSFQTCPLLAVPECAGFVVAAAPVAVDVAAAVTVAVPKPVTGGLAAAKGVKAGNQLLNALAKISCATAALSSELSGVVVFVATAVRL
jgi:hypothetical protein